MTPRSSTGETPAPALEVVVELVARLAGRLDELTQGPVDPGPEVLGLLWQAHLVSGYGAGDRVLAAGPGVEDYADMAAARAERDRVADLVARAAQVEVVDHRGRVQATGTVTGHTARPTFTVRHDDGVERSWPDHLVREPGERR